MNVHAQLNELTSESGGLLVSSRWDIALSAIVVALYASFPISLALTSVLMVLLIVVWLLGGYWRGLPQVLTANPVAVAALALYGVILLGVAWTPAPWSDVSLHLSKYAKLPFAVLLMTFLVSSRVQKHALTAFVAVMAFILVSTWLNVWWDLPWSKTHNQGWGVTHHVVGDYITQNVMMSFFVLLALGRARSAVGWRPRLVWGVVALMAAMSITHMSDGRTGYVLLATVLGYFALTAFNGRAALAALALGAVALGLTLASSSLMQDRFRLAFEEAVHVDADKMTSIGNRVYLYKITPKLIADKPFFGHGTGAYHREICRFADTPQGCHEWINWHPHNQFLFFTADHGILGLIAYLSLIFAMAWMAYQSSDRETRLLLGGLVSLLVVDSMTNSPLWSARESHLFFLMMALLVSKAKSTALLPEHGSRSADQRSAWVRMFSFRR